MFICEKAIETNAEYKGLLAALLQCHSRQCSPFARTNMSTRKEKLDIISGLHHHDTSWHLDTDSHNTQDRQTNNLKPRVNIHRAVRALK